LVTDFIAVVAVGSVTIVAVGAFVAAVAVFAAVVAVVAAVAAVGGAATAWKKSECEAGSELASTNLTGRTHRPIKTRKNKSR
jgi:hypothetical protein